MNLCKADFISDIYIFIIINPYRIHLYFRIHRVSNMRVHVLLNLLNKLMKRDQMQGLQSILSLFFAKRLINQ